MGIGDWGLGPIPNPQSPIPISHIFKNLINNFINKKNILFTFKFHQRKNINYS